MNQEDRVCQRLEDNDPSFNKLCFDWTSIETGSYKKICDALCKNSVVEEVIFYEVGRAGTITNCLTKILEKNRSIKSLWIFKTDVGGTDGLKQIFGALKKNRSLEYLLLEHFYTDIDDSCVEVLADVLVNNNSLRSLGLEGERISTNGVRMLMEALEFNTSLESIALPKKRSNKDLQYITNVLKTNKTLKQLYVGTVEYSRETMANFKELCNTLANNKTVDDFQISIKGDSVYGGKHLSDAIKMNKTIVGLQICFTNDTLFEDNHCIKYLTDAIKQNTTLEVVDITYGRDGIPQEGWVLLLSKMFEYHPTLKELDFGCKIITGTEQREWFWRKED